MANDDAACAATMECVEINIVKYAIGNRKVIIKTVNLTSLICNSISLLRMLNQRFL
jgi:hypothetical protein